MWANFSAEDLEGDAVLEGERDGGGEGVHEAGDGGAFLGHADEDFAGAAVGVEADGDVALVAAEAEFVGDGGALGGEAVADGAGRAAWRRGSRSCGATVEGGELARGRRCWVSRCSRAREDGMWSGGAGGGGEGLAASRSAAMVSSISSLGGVRCRRRASAALLVGGLSCRRLFASVETLRGWAPLEPSR